MKTTTIAFSAASVLVTSVAVFVFKTSFVVALAAASTSATSTDAEPAIGLADTASSTPSASASSTVAALAALTTAATSSPNQAQTHGNGKPALKRVRVVGSKYVDFFTDGTTIFSFPGDPSIDANLNKPGAPIPMRTGLTWVSTKAMEAYDTASGDLEAGTYAQESDGSFISNTADAIDGTTSPPRFVFSKLDPSIDPASFPSFAPPSLPQETSAAFVPAATSAAATSPGPLAFTAMATSTASSVAASSTASSAPADSAASTTSLIVIIPAATTTATAAASTTTATDTVPALMQQ